MIALERDQAARGCMTSSREPRTGEVLFLAPGDVGKGRVEPISWMQTCRAYARLGMDVCLVTLRVRRPDSVAAAEIWTHYGVEPTFRIRVLPTMLGRAAPVRWFQLSAAAAGLAFALRELPGSARRLPRVVVHARAPVLLAPWVVLRLALPRGRRPLLVLETHSLPKRSNGWIVRAAELVVVNSEPLAADVRAAFDLPAERVLHAPLGPYNSIRQRPKDEARRELGLPQDAVLAAYCGKMTEEHNEFLLRAAETLAAEIPSLRLLLVGGNPEIRAWTRRRAVELEITGTLILAGFVPPARVELYQAAADVLVYHMPSSLLIFPYCTPAKGYEYQAAGRPIVATDIPLFEEVFGCDGERAIRVVERTPEALAEGVLAALALEDGGRSMTERAAAWVEGRTWESRTEAILQALGI